MLAAGITASAYNVVDLPESMPFDEAMGIFSADDIEKAIISNYDDRRYIELTAEETVSLYNNMKSITLKRQINPMPFRGTALTLYTRDGKKMSYYSTSGVEIGLYGSSNYICYAADGEGAQYMTNIDTLYQDSEEKIGGDILYRTTANDFLKLPTELWGQTPVKEAAANDLLPYEFTDKYNEYISREDFCKLMAQLICVVGNYASLDGYMEDKDTLYLTNYFADCTERDNSINMLYALGIISGTSDTEFDPGGQITREQAAAVLCRTAEKFMYIQTYGNLNFSDAASVAQWARYYVIWANENSIMNGSEGRFSPQEPYTVLQAITSVNRLYKVLVRNINY